MQDILNDRLKKLRKYLMNKVIIISGLSKGLGLGLAKNL